MSLERGAYPKYSHVLCCHIQLAFFIKTFFFFFFFLISVNCKLLLSAAETRPCKRTKQTDTWSYSTARSAAVPQIYLCEQALSEFPNPPSSLLSVFFPSLDFFPATFSYPLADWAFTINYLYETRLRRICDSIRQDHLLCILQIHASMLERSVSSIHASSKAIRQTPLFFLRFILNFIGGPPQKAAVQMQTYSLV